VVDIAQFALIRLASFRRAYGLVKKIEVSPSYQLQVKALNHKDSVAMKTNRRYAKK
jgi:hypothetical protein